MGIIPEDLARPLLPAQRTIRSKTKALSDVRPIEPWDREFMRQDEVPLVMKRLFNFDIANMGVYRWVHNGVPVKGTKRKDGRFVKLGITKIGGRNYVSQKQLKEFLDRI